MIMIKEEGKFEELIKKRFFYDHVDGNLYKIYKSLVSLTGHKTKYGYIRVKIPENGKNPPQIMAHRIAWFLYHGKWPSNFIDHINGNRSDNKIENLRDVYHQENCKNSLLVREGKQIYFGYYPKKNSKFNFVARLIKGYDKKKRKCSYSCFSYECEFQARMAADMIDKGIFNPNVHNRKSINSINKGIAFILDNYKRGITEVIV